MSGEGDHEYLTARELAHLLRVRERKVYELAAAGEVPCSRATGKLLFRRVSVDAWLARSSSGPTATPVAVRPDVIGGSHDPLLDWALRESGAGLATLFDGSLDGLERFAGDEVVASALHVPAAVGARGGHETTLDASDEEASSPPAAPGRKASRSVALDGGASSPAPPGRDASPLAAPEGEASSSAALDGERASVAMHDGTVSPIAAFEWNVPLVRERFGDEPVVLIAFARRVRGLIVAAGDEARVRGIEDLAGRRVVPRQRGAGSQVLFERLVAAAALAPDTFELVPPARTESDAALAVAEGRADVAFGLAGPAAQLGLAFVPIATERFDLLVDRRAWFEPPLQRLAAFCATAAFRERAAALGGYDVADVGTIRFNGEG